MAVVRFLWNHIQHQYHLDQKKILRLIGSRKFIFDERAGVGGFGAFDLFATVPP